MAIAIVSAKTLANDLISILFNINTRAYIQVPSYAYALITVPSYARTNAYANAQALGHLIEYARQLQKLPEVFKNLDYNTLIIQLQELKTKLPDKNQPKKIHQEFAQRIIDTWFQAFHLRSELIKLSRAALEKIDKQYFYINWLIVQCKEAAVRVSPQTWSAIEERMLLPPDNISQI